MPARDAQPFNQPDSQRRVTFARFGYDCAAVVCRLSQTLGSKRADAPMNHTDYENFDFSAAAKEIRTLGGARGTSSVFADTISALYFKAKYGECTAKFLEESLGSPDSVEAAPTGKQIYEYKWAGFQSIQSITRFVISGNRVVGVEE